jgi:hypothetical protein
MLSQEEEKAIADIIDGCDDDISNKFDYTNLDPGIVKDLANWALALNKECARHAEELHKCNEELIAALEDREL